MSVPPKNGAADDAMQQFGVDFAAELEKQFPVVIVLSWEQAWAALTALGIALTHPALTGPSGEMAREVTTMIYGHVSKTPALRSVADELAAGRTPGEK